MLKQKLALLILGFLISIVSGSAEADSANCPLKQIPSATPYLSSLKDLGQFQSLMRAGPGLSYVKFLFEINGQQRDFFQNSLKYEYHYPFLRAEVSEYASLSSMEYEKFLFAQPKVFSAGAIYYVGCKPHPVTKKPGFGAFGLYFKDKVNLDEVVAAHKRLSTVVTFSATPLVFVFERKEDYFTGAVELRNRGVESVTLAQVTDTAKGSVYHPAKSYGYLRPLTLTQFNAGEYTAKDILVLDQVPLDVGPIAGLLTTSPQMPHSHMILRAINQNIPDAYVLENQMTALLAKYAGKLVELETLASGEVRVKGEDLLGTGMRAEAEVYFRQRVPVLPPLKKDLQIKELLPLGPQTIVTADLVKAYGAKGTNFALIDQALRKAKIDRSYFSGAFLIPFVFYDKHVSQKLSSALCEKTTKKCKEQYADRCQEPHDLCTSYVKTNGSLREFLVSMGTAPISESLIEDPVKRKMFIAYAQTLLKQAPLDIETKTQLMSQLTGPNHKANQRIRFRSSTNAEDLPGFNGAGFYTSKSACLEDDETAAGSQGSVCMTAIERARIQKNIDHLKALDANLYKDLILDLTADLTEKKPLDKAVRGVFASLWNEKAFLFRDYYRIKHDDVYMGILVHPAFADETANGVAMVQKKSLNQLEINVVTQVDDVSVTNPVLPKAEPEHFVVLKPKVGVTPVPTYISHSNLTAQGKNVLNPKQIADLTRQMVLVWQTLGEKLVGEKTIDVEFIALANGKIAIKQGRPLGQVQVPGPNPNPNPNPNPGASGKGSFSFSYHNHQWNFIKIKLESGLKIEIGTPQGDASNSDRNLNFGFRPTLAYNQVILTQGSSPIFDLSVWPDQMGSITRDSIFCQNVISLAEKPGIVYPIQMEAVAGQFGLVADADFQDCGMSVKDPTSADRMYPRDLVCMFSPPKNGNPLGPKLVVLDIPWAKGQTHFPFLDEWPVEKINLCIDGKKYILDQQAPQ